MNNPRRIFLKRSGQLGALALAWAAGLAASRQAWAATWNKAGFQSKAMADAMKNLGASGATESKDIVITAPDIAAICNAVSDFLLTKQQKAEAGLDA